MHHSSSSNRLRTATQLVLALLLVSYTTLDVMAASNGTKSPHKQRSLKGITRTRTFHFPEQSLGALYVIPSVNWGNPDGQPATAVAKGKVTLQIPPGMEVLLRANAIIVQQPELIDSLPPDEIGTLEIRAPLVDLDDAGNTDQKSLIKHLLHLTGLKRLNLYMSMGDKELAQLKSLKHLERLMTITGTATGSCWRELKELPELQQLDFSDNPIKTENLHYLAEFPKLNTLILHRCLLNNHSIEILHNLRNLTNLSIPTNGRVTDESMKYVAQMKTLTWIDLYDTGVTIDGLEQVATLPNLKHVQVLSARFPEKRLRRLAESKPGLSIQITGTSRPVDKTTRHLFAPLK